ncbi:hypothetical protein A2686_01770 [Candidatus Woesebacteria bacterium RIFCSPHIGHO2_01_FULL_38_10]|uniref:Uncharacterized protein n=1 Tax=Candidatus Woesebacteria bacterium RIFCSPLOWO2_01_FULL_39_10b TaxID=1802517 RepID=A0A1F8B6I1_9BACT|nr:MAG: hypothetical protein A2686_01770 [Candidatus Woesebacteria bacterium RIFCSPHIGHO2_01_FULL_38_10]OGM59520.1 MAG: hypothetical protein A2892_02700 [Candidatus Woesebacteria bacterium RIFCSPLOWO2_01_FULL_39_10b]
MQKLKEKILKAIKVPKFLHVFLFASFVSLFSLILVWVSVSSTLKRKETIKTKAAEPDAGKFFDLPTPCTNCGNMMRVGSRFFLIDEGASGKRLLSANLSVNGIEDIRTSEKWSVIDNFIKNNAASSPAQISVKNENLLWVLLESVTNEGGYKFDVYRYQFTSGNWQQARQTFDTDNFSNQNKLATAISNVDNQGNIWIVTRWGTEKPYTFKIYRIDTNHPSVSAVEEFNSLATNFPDVNKLTTISKLVTYGNHLLMLTKTEWLIPDTYPPQTNYSNFLTTVNITNPQIPLILNYYEPRYARELGLAKDISIDRQENKLWVSYGEYIYSASARGAGACSRPLNTLGTEYIPWNCLQTTFGSSTCPENTAIGLVNLISADHSYPSTGTYNNALWLSRKAGSGACAPGVLLCRTGASGIQSCRKPLEANWPSFNVNALYNYNPGSESLLIGTSGNGLKLYDPYNKLVNSVCVNNYECPSNICAQDQDNDGHVAITFDSAQAKRCQPEGRLTDDCYDKNANAYPKSSYWGITNRGDGSFDYNCDGTPTRRYPCITNISSKDSSYFTCSSDKKKSKNAGFIGNLTSIPDCGKTGTTYRCAGYPQSSCSGTPAYANVCASGDSLCQTTLTTANSYKIVSSSVAQECQ